MKLYQTLENQIKKEPNYVSDNGEIKKWVVLNKAQNFDEELIGLLLEDADLKEKFFIQIKEVWVFKQNLFIQFLEQKNYLNDSYTQFKNKVGLTIDGKHLKQRNEVSLVWPFKDCILEGGQSREEDKREEIFFNEVLAQDEITELLDPKVLTNAKRFDENGERVLCHSEQSEESLFNRNESGTITDNLIIKGNNLLALHSLKKEFAGKVKLIYIDPPYNTGNDGFKYNDSFNHSTWLTFMKNRLEIAKNILSNDGTIAISIDHNELGYMVSILDEVFGTQNRKNIITIKRSSVSGAKVINPGVVNVSEFLLLYSKSTSQWKPEKVFRAKDRDDRYNNFIINIENNPESWKYESVLDAFARHKKIQKSKLKKELGIDYELELETFFIEHRESIIRFAGLDDNSISEGVKATKYLSKNDESQTYVFRRKDHNDYFLYKGNAILFFKDRLIQVDGEWKFGEMISDIWNDVLPNDIHNEGGVKLRKGKKPEKLINRLIELCSNEKDIILDYHLGSGTTAAVAHKMNRQYIGIEQLNYGENDSVIRLQNVINGDKTGISKSVNWQGGGSFIYLELKKYNQTFIEKIEEAKDEQTLLQIWQEMKAKSFLNYNVDIQKQEKHIEDFKRLNLQEQKQHLCELLDKNQLYVNLSSLKDGNFECTPEEQKVTQEFYQLKN
ncbi:site-specific DNA-methyltransferase [Chryseobacterium sp.]|uniref:site-specific DNA-methyltransferase n=1 Tax=Chryseobacterium sp. TaxID=1871047 RepID=UPI00321B7738